MGLQFLKPTLKMKPNEDEVNLLWPSVPKMECADSCHTAEIEEIGSTSDSSFEVSSTRRKLSSKKSRKLHSTASMTIQNSLNFSPQTRRQIRRKTSSRLVSQNGFRAISRNIFKKRISVFEKTTSKKQNRSNSPLQYPEESLSEIFLAEETLSLGSPRGNSAVSSSYRRVSALHIRESSMPCQLQKNVRRRATSLDKGQMSRAFRRLMQPRRKCVRMQTLPEPEPTPPPSPTESEKEFDFMRRCEMFKSSRAFDRLTAPPKVESKESHYYKIPSVKAPLSDFFDDSDYDETTPLCPKSYQSTTLKIARFKKKNINDSQYTPKVTVLKRKDPSLHPKRKKIDLPKKRTSSTKIFERLTASPKKAVYSLGSSLGTLQSCAQPDVHGDTRTVGKPKPQTHLKSEGEQGRVSYNSSFEGFSKHDKLRSKVFERLTAIPKKRTITRSIEKRPLLEKSPSNTSISSWDKLELFQSSAAYDRLTRAPDKPVSSLSREGSFKCEEPTSSILLSTDSNDENESIGQKSPVFERLLAPRKEPPISAWGRSSSIKHSITFKKLRELLNKTLENSRKDCQTPEESKSPSRKSSAFLRLTAPNYRQKTINYKRKASRFNKSTSLECLLEPSNTPRSWQKSILKNSPTSILTENNSFTQLGSPKNDEFPSIEAVPQNKPCTPLSDISYETISVVSDKSETSEELNKCDFGDQETTPLLHNDNFPPKTQIKSNNRREEVSTLRRRMSYLRSKVLSEVNNHTPSRQDDKDIQPCENKTEGVWIPFSSFRPIYD